jgi:hypothetical protein
MMAATALAVLPAAGLPARADDVTFGSDGKGVSVTVSAPGSPGGVSGGVTCTYELAGNDDTTKALFGHQGDPGAVYSYRCSNGDMALAFFPAPQAVGVAALAQQASRYLPLPSPGIRTSPPPDREQLVHLRTWLWVDRAGWGPRWATASVPGVSATVTAVPVSVTWAMGDGSRVVCRGPGTPYDPARPERAQRPSCSYVYRHSSAGQPAGQFTVTATATWQITWTAGGGPGSGTLPPLSRSSQVGLRVAEVQALNTTPH